MARWHICNVLQSGAAVRQLWQFDASGAGFKLSREQVILPSQPIPPGPVAKSWDSLWRKKLNVALLSNDKVFLRVLQLPVADEAEARQIVELQLERLSPLPVTQLVWTLHLLPKGEGATRTAIVLIADRSVVEKFLGQLEAEGFLADRLELPELDQVLATTPTGDGAWIFPAEPGAPALVAWWTEGQLRSLAWLNLPEGEGREAVLREQLLQMAWAGELEGWLTQSPRFHLVADAPTAAEWRPLFERWVETPLQVSAPLPPAELAARTARRSAADQASLMPQEFLKRYQQQFVDRLWMRGLGSVILLYFFGVLVYFAALQVLEYKLDGAEQSLKGTSLSYTNALQAKARYDVLRDRADLKFAALDSWKSLADELPESIVLQSLDLRGGRTLTINVTGPSDAGPKVSEFYDHLRRSQANGKPLFDITRGNLPTYNTAQGNVATWRFDLELDRAEKP